MTKYFINMEKKCPLFHLEFKVIFVD